LRIREFKKSVSVDIGAPFGNIEIAEDALAADVLINCPKLKTHCQMLMTLGVKNMFGCVVGLRKPEWHFRTGVDRELFARLLVQIYATVKPDITILDGILAMQGQGPGRSGKPCELNVLMVSDDAVALDMTVCKMLGMEPDNLLTNRIASERGLAPEYEIEGDLPQIKDFRLPLMVPLIFGPPALHRTARKYLMQRPVVNGRLCKMCGECGRYCPAKAITDGPYQLRFDYDRCIRCYCCIEVCPHGALETKENILSRLARRVFRSKT
jgi:ferredoxin